MKYLYSKDISQSYTEKVRKVVKVNKTKDQEEAEESIEDEETLDSAKEE